MVRDLALELLGLHEKIHEWDKLIEARFREHELAPVISSMPGIGPLLGAEFLAATGGDLSRFPSADRLAAFSVVAPVPRDSGNVNGNLHRPRRYHRGLQRVFYRSARKLGLTGVTGLIPLIGEALRCLALRGSDLVANWLLVAVLIKDSYSARRPRPPQPQT